VGGKGGEEKKKTPQSWNKLIFNNKQKKTRSQARKVVARTRKHSLTRRGEDLSAKRGGGSPKHQIPQRDPRCPPEKGRFAKPTYRAVTGEKKREKGRKKRTPSSQREPRQRKKTPC